MAPFNEDNLQRIMINPFYAVTVASQLIAEHEPPMGEAEWVQTNASLIKDIGAEKWLGQLLEVLEGKSQTADERISPFHAINIDPMFAVDHPPIIEGEMWVDVNVLQMRNMGTEGWLQQLLDVLNGDVVTAEEVGLAHPLSGGSPFSYRASTKYYTQRRGKQKRKKRRNK